MLNWCRLRSTSAPGSSRAAVRMPKSAASAAPIFMRELLRWALPSADRAAGAEQASRLHGGEHATQARTRRLNCFPTVQPTRVTPCSDSSAVGLGRPGDSGSGQVASGSVAAQDFVDEVLGQLSQFAVFGLAERPQLREPLVGAAPTASPNQADRL